MNELPRGLKIATVWLLLGLGLFMGVQAWQAVRQASRFSNEGGRIAARSGVSADSTTGHVGFRIAYDH